MSQADLILLHPPSVYDFRKEPRMFGPISDVVPSSPIFEMYPIGFMIMQGYLQQHGLRVRIVNVAVKMLRSLRYDVEKEIKCLNPLAFGIDLHWLTHAHGSLALAEIVKKYHPDIPVIFGGLSSSYYHEELLTYPQVDYVLRGDSVEEPLRMLLETIKRKQEPADVPNLTWREKTGTVRVNELSHSPGNLDYYPFDYSRIIKSTIRHRDILGHLPFNTWLRYPIVVMLPWRGCVHNCVICGGSAQFYRSHCGRKKPAYRSPEMVASDMALTSRYLKGPIFLLGDLRQAGGGYAQELFKMIKAAKIVNQIVIELFYPAERSYLQGIADAVPNFNIEISPESHDEQVRKAFGRHYTNAGLEQTIEDALALGCKRIDLFFMIGLPRQTPQSVKQTVQYCGELIGRYARYGIGKVVPCISPLAPFLDPGSLAFEDPETHGYTLFCRSLEQHRCALTQPSWKYMLSYETKWMSRDEIVESTYTAALDLNAIKAGYGSISQKEAQHVRRRIDQAREQIRHIDTLVEMKDTRMRAEAILKYTLETTKLSQASICKKEELQWPFNAIRFNPLSLIKAIVRR